jgi:hypothetical protein
MTVKDLAKEEQKKIEARRDRLRRGIPTEPVEETRRREQVHEFCNAKMKDGLTYNDAFAACKREKPELFANMRLPSHPSAEQLIANLKH